MKWIILILVLAGLLFAGTHDDNMRYLKYINRATERIQMCSYAYFVGASIGGYYIELTQVQKDSLISIVNNQIQKIQLYADSLQQYSP